MHLIERDGNNFKIYELTPKHDKVFDFKVKEMQKIPFDLRVIRAITNDKNILDNATDMYDVPFDKLDYCKNLLFYKRYHKIEFHKELQNKKDMYKYVRAINYIQQVLNRYYEGLYDDGHLISIKNGLPNLDYILTKSEYILQNEHSKLRSVSDILNLPETLYLLHLLFKEKYKLLEGKNISSQIELFSFNDIPIKIYDVKEIKERDAASDHSSDEPETLYDSLSKKSEDCANILRLVKK